MIYAATVSMNTKLLSYIDELEHRGGGEGMFGISEGNSMKVMIPVTLDISILFEKGGEGLNDAGEIRNVVSVELKKTNE